MKKILLIEDNDDIRNNTAEILELSSYTVITAENGKEGVEKAIAHVPDLIICDIMMPVLDGYGVLHAIQRNEAIRNVPFIFLTAKTERSDFRKGMELGADDYITKPFSGTELLNAVDGRLKKVDLLKQEFSPGLEGLEQLLKLSDNKTALTALTEDRDVNKYKKKQLIYSEGNHPTRLYYVQKGKVKTYRTNDDGKELTTELFSAGDFLGYIALLEGTPYKDTAEALDEAELAIIPREEFTELINNNRIVAQKFIRLLAKNIVVREEQLLGLAYNSLRKKVADALILLENKYRNTADTDMPFAISISREGLAAIAGTATESLIRTLSDFRSEKLIEIREGNIVILNRKKLENLLN
ncbi:response regulator [Niabella drilacis]|uniref:cAMP-binding domain of CRP or a regulatory subunit of cAMP-dependent protein kinases n=1 Tax=Niabella drilacis (strain DSM 25811 / CCM 8410 / CCUG 62505 / LMG 26954 / E90) TaxID=1285928 RepID=A0A1G6UV63_NIADE|nr:response regulator [Niabella drilacis]SDD45163.1 cAMP-binding domain of CRP or a regulatory subunit of cAMP-dependent protein kinases [Niabella drilacis]